VRALALLLPVLLFAAQARADGDEIRLGGALRFNYVYADWSGPSRGTGGTFVVDTLRIEADGELSDLLFSAEYRFYSGYQMLHHGWIGYEPGEDVLLQLGVVQVPFGVLPFASHNWFFQLPYYVGLEDDYDAGLVSSWSPGDLQLHLAFFKSDEGSFLGSSTSSARYSYDVVEELPELGTRNREANQINGRAAWLLRAGALEAELGISLQWGQLYDAEVGRYGDRQAGALHVDANLGRWNLRVELVRYAFAPVRDPGGFVVMGAYDAPYLVARAGTIYVLGLSHRVPVSLGPVEALVLYDDFSLLDKHVEGFEDSVQNVAGVLIEAGPVLTYVDLATGRNQPFIGPDYTNALARGAEGFHTRFNVNVGYYF
jgi:hypothetical protein